MNKPMILLTLLVSSNALAEAPFSQWPNKFECTVTTLDLKPMALTMPKFVGVFKCLDETCKEDKRVYVCEEKCHDGQSN